MKDTPIKDTNNHTADSRNMVNTDKRLDDILDKLTKTYAGALPITEYYEIDEAKQDLEALINEVVRAGRHGEISWTIINLERRTTNLMLKLAKQRLANLEATLNNDKENLNG